MDELDRTALDPFEYESMLLHREGIGEELEIAGVEALHDRLDELDVRFQTATVEDGSSPFAPGSGRGTIDDGLRNGWWWCLPADEDDRAYTTSLP